MIDIQDFAVDDLNEVMTLWSSIPELNFPIPCNDETIKTYDSEEKLRKFLRKNVGLSTVAKADGRIVGALLCGEDGRWGYIHHIGIHPDLRGQKIATRMVEYTFAKLREACINACYLFTTESNTRAQEFWNKMGFGFDSQVMFHSRAI